MADHSPVEAQNLPPVSEVDEPEASGYDGTGFDLRLPNTLRSLTPWVRMLSRLLAREQYCGQKAKPHSIAQEQTCRPLGAASTTPGRFFICSCPLPVCAGHGNRVVDRSRCAGKKGSTSDCHTAQQPNIKSGGMLVQCTRAEDWWWWWCQLSTRGGQTTPALSYNGEADTARHCSKS